MNRNRAHQIVSRFSSTSFRSLFGVAMLALLAALIVLPLRRIHAADRGKVVKPTATASVKTDGLNIAALHGQKYELRMHHLHSGENIDVVYRIGNTYIPSALTKLNYFLRDSRTGQVGHYPDKEFDTLHAMLVKLGRPDALIDVVCGYRSPWSNNFLRTRGGTVSPSVTGVALHSQHELAKAIDLRIPGFTTLQIRNAAMSLHAGGVGYYPVSQFVHVDVGPVRHWMFPTEDTKG